MKNILFITALLINCANTVQSISTQKIKIKETTEITEIEDARTHIDSVYVIDLWSYNDKGNRKPPCSFSPDPCGCMESRGIVVRIWDCK